MAAPSATLAITIFVRAASTSPEAQRGAQVDLRWSTSDFPVAPKNANAPSPSSATPLKTTPATGNEERAGDGGGAGAGPGGAGVVARPNVTSMMRLCSPSRAT